MTGTATLTVEQYDAIQRLRESLTPTERDALKRIVITPASVLTPNRRDYIRVKFDAGWGAIEYDIDAEGNSEHVAFGFSSISA